MGVGGGVLLLLLLVLKIRSFFYVLPAYSHAPSGQGDLETDFITSKDSLHGENWPIAAGPNP